MAKCMECGNAMTKTVGDHIYVESGLDNVVLHNITKLHCESCGAKSIEIPAIKQLHRVIANAIARKPARLEPPEVRFLRDHLGLTNVEFAALMGVTASQASRWTTTEPIGTPAERLLRLLATLGPGVLRPAEQAIKAQETVDGVADLIGHLPPSSVEAKTVKIGVRRAGANGWKQVNAIAN